MPIGPRLVAADLTRADLTVSGLTKANLSNAMVTERQLMQPRPLWGANLSNNRADSSEEDDRSRSP